MKGKDIQVEIEKRMGKPLKTLQILENEIEVRIPELFLNLGESVDSVKRQINELKEKIQEPESEEKILEKKMEFLEGEVDIILERLGRRTVFEELNTRIKRLENRNKQPPEQSPEISI